MAAAWRRRWAAGLKRRQLRMLLMHGRRVLTSDSAWKAERERKQAAGSHLLPTCGCVDRKRSLSE